MQNLISANLQQCVWITAKIQLKQSSDRTQLNVKMMKMIYIFLKFEYKVFTAK